MTNIYYFVHYFHKTVLTSSNEGGGYTISLWIHKTKTKPNKTAKETNPGYLNNFKFILCDHFDNKQITIKNASRVSRQSPHVGVITSPEKIKSKLLKNLCML